MYVLKIRLAGILLFVAVPLLVLGRGEMFQVPTPYPLGTGSPNIFTVFVLYTAIAILLLSSAFLSKRS